jgi:predicted alpha/beta-hydrolase family hydrolase
MTAAPHSQLVMKVARSMHNAGHDAGFFNFPWDKVADHGREKYGVLAQAALEACYAEEMLAVLRRVADWADGGDSLNGCFSEVRALLAKLDGRS